MSLSPFQSAPFPITELVAHYSVLLSLYDLANCTRVNPAWRAAIKLPAIWQRLFDQEKIPRIEGRESAAYEDFNVMFPITYSKRKICCLGEFVGDVPTLSAIVFNQLVSLNDSYAPLYRPNKMRETFAVIVEPTHLYRHYDKSLVDELVKNGDFDLNAPENADLEIKGILVPYSLKNLKILAEHPVTGNASIPVFCFFNPEILEQCSSISKKVNVTVMRKEVPAHMYNLTLDAQKKHLKTSGYVMVKILPRLYFDVVEILTKGSCPDRCAENCWIYTRTSDRIRIQGRFFYISVGGYCSGTGITVYTRSNHAYGDLGSIPCVCAQTVQSAKHT